MNKAERIDAEVEKKMEESGTLAYEADALAEAMVFRPSHIDKGLADITVTRDPNGEATHLVHINDRHRWTPGEMDALTAWAHDMLDDEPENAP